MSVQTNCVICVNQYTKQVDHGRSYKVLVRAQMQIRVISCSYDLGWECAIFRIQNKVLSKSKMLKVELFHLF